MATLRLLHLQPVEEALAIGDMRRLCRFKRVQDVPCHVCRSRLAVTVALKLVDDLTLPPNVTFAFNNMAFGSAKVVEEHRPVHDR
jgi:hypothetical protein